MARMIIDGHCHVWPDHVAARVLADRPAGLDPRHDGTIAGLRQAMDRAGIDRAVCMGVAHVARTVDRTNEFIGSLDRSRFIPFGTVHPDLDIARNLWSLHENGIRGVKLHPLFQDVSFSDPRVMELARALAAESIAVIAHTGSGGSDVANLRGDPAALRTLIDAVPDLRLISCHFGGYLQLGAAQRWVVGSPAFVDTSWPPGLAGLDRDTVRKIIRTHGVERVVFGSDWPMADPGEEIAAIRALGLPTEEEQAVLGANLARMLDLMA
jgi:predicted TIM-barrel fold metal-dependent hydrolase